MERFQLILLPANSTWLPRRTANGRPIIGQWHNQLLIDGHVARSQFSPAAKKWLNWRFAEESAVWTSSYPLTLEWARVSDGRNRNPDGLKLPGCPVFRFSHFYIVKKYPKNSPIGKAIF